MYLTVAALAVAALCAGMLVAALVQIHGLRVTIDDLAAKSKAAARKAADAEPSPVLDGRLAAVEDGLRDVLAAQGRLDRSIRSERRADDRSAASTPPPPGSRLWEDARDPGDHSLDAAVGLRTAGKGTSCVATTGSRDAEPNPGIEQSNAFANSVETYRELIARPRKNDIVRWFEEAGGLPCEATDEGLFQLVERGEGARLTLLPLTDRFALVLPSALMVVDFPTSFADVLSARAAVRQTFDLDADGSGTLRLVQPALAMLADGVWRLKTSGRLAGLANG